MKKIQEKQPPDVITSDTENATKIHPNEARPENREKFRRFRAYNTGTWNGPRRENKKVIHRQDNLHRFDAIASSLELSDVQKNWGRDLFDSLHLTEFNKWGETIDSVIFGLCVLIVNDSVTDGTRYWPHPDAGTNDKLFEKVGDNLDLSVSDQMSITQRLRSKVDL